MTVILEGVALRKRFGLTEALRGADLTVRAGEVVAVMGPSGSGKSTLLHCLAGILRPDDGSVVFDGRRVDTLSDRQRTLLRRGAFGFVFQFGQLVPELTAIENVAAPLLLAGQRRRPAIAAAQAWFERLALTGLQGRLPGELSGGQAQRVAVARALIGRPRVVFADEPTGALDTAAGDDVMELLVTSVREQDAAAVVVTHEPRVAAFADRTVLVQDGLVDADAEAGVVG
jgi:putative ABC transport system ATP-binding protein